MSSDESSKSPEEVLEECVEDVMDPEHPDLLRGALQEILFQNQE